MAGANLTPDARDFARDAAEDMAECHRFRQQVEHNIRTYREQGNYSGTGFPEFMMASPLVAEAWIRRAVTAEAALAWDAGYITDEEFKSLTGHSAPAVLTADIVELVRAMLKAVNPCTHRFVDARNEVVASGSVCVDCGAVRPGVETEVANG